MAAMVAVMEDCGRSEASVTTADTSAFGAFAAASFCEPAGAVAVLEAALGAWQEFEPDSPVISEDILHTVLEDVARRVPGNRESQMTLDLLVEVFTPTTAENEQPIFQRMLRPRRHQIHLLHFWRAFAEVARLLGSPACANDALVEEVELVRDTILKTLDASAEDGGHGVVSYSHQRMSAKDLVKLMRETASMSMVPGFWVSLEQALCRDRRYGKSESFSWDDLTVLAMSWFRQAAAGRPTEDVARKNSTRSSVSSLSRVEGLPVYIHIYDVSHEDNVHKLNKFLAHKRNPCKFGGVFHAGIEVNGLEWAFGMSCSETVPGICCCLPKENSEHRYRETVRLRNTNLSAEKVAEVIAQMIEDYPGDDYDLLRRNCCHFADDFVRRLGAGRLPGWVRRLARLGAFVDGAMMRIANRSLLPDDDDLY